MKIKINIFCSKHQFIIFRDFLNENKMLFSNPNIFQEEYTNCKLLFYNKTNKNVFKRKYCKYIFVDSPVYSMLFMCFTNIYLLKKFCDE